MKADNTKVQNSHKGNKGAKKFIVAPIKEYRKKIGSHNENLLKPAAIKKRLEKI